MTRGDYKQVMKLMTPQEAYDFSVKICQHFNEEPLTLYKQTADSEVMHGAATRALYTNKALNLLRRAIFLGATYPEILRISEYFCVVTKALEKKLDYKRCEKDMRISDLEQKFSQKDFLSLPFDYSVMKRTYEKAMGYFEEMLEEKV